MAELLRTLLWQEVGDPGLHWCEFSGKPAGWRIAGTVLTTVAGEPALVRYEVALDEQWATREVLVDSRLGAGTREQRLHLSVDREQRWRIQRDPAPHPAAAPDETEALRELIDIDLGFSPATNTLPIRRLAPAIGDAVDVTAVWVSFPELTVEPLPQQYIRLDERRYRYESDGGAFVTEIEVDDLGLVVTYEGGWRRIAEASATG